MVANSRVVWSTSLIQSSSKDRKCSAPTSAPATSILEFLLPRSATRWWLTLLVPHVLISALRSTQLSLLLRGQSTTQFLRFSKPTGSARASAQMAITICFLMSVMVCPKMETASKKLSSQLKTMRHPMQLSCLSLVVSASLAQLLASSSARWQAVNSEAKISTTIIKQACPPNSSEWIWFAALLAYTSKKCALFWSQT